MAYNLRYQIVFRGFRNDILYELDIYQDSYSGSSEYIDYGGKDDPVIERIRGSEEDVGSIIYGRQLEVTIHPPPGDWDKFDGLLDASYHEYYCIFKRAGSETFRGWLQPENLEANFIYSPYKLKLSFTDGLAGLKDEPYVQDETNDYFLDEHLTIIEALGIALKKTGFTLDIEVMMNTYEENLMDANSSNQHPNECALKVCYINMKRFIEHKWIRDRVDDLDDHGTRYRRGGTGASTNFIMKADMEKVDDCYTVIQKLLQPFNATLTQHGGRWVIENKQELDSQVFLFDGTDYSEVSGYPQAIDNILILDDDKFEPFGSYSKIAPKKRIYVDYMRRKLGERYDSVDSWDQTASNPEWDISTNTNYFTYTVNSSSDSELDISISYVNGQPTPNDKVRIRSDNFTVQLPSDYDSENSPSFLKLRLQARANNDISGYDYPPGIHVRVYRPDGSRQTERMPFILNRKYGYWESPENEVFAITDETDGGYSIELVITPPYNLDLASNTYSYGSLDLQFKGRPDVRLEDTDNQSAKDTRQYQETNVPGISNGTLTLHFGDAATGDEVNALTILDGGVYEPTADWNRWERDDGIPLVWTYLQQQLNNYRGYANMVRLGKYDMDDEITPRKILQIDNGRGPKYYQIIGWTKKYHTGYVDMQLREIFPSYIYGDVNNPVIEYTLDQIDGMNQIIRFPSVRALDVSYVNGKLASIVQSEAETAGSNKSYAGQNVNDWNDYPALADTDKRFGIRVDKTNNRVIVGLLNVDDTTSNITYEVELEVYNATITGSANSDATGEWSGTAPSLPTVDSADQLATMSATDTDDACYTFNLDDVTNAQFRLKIISYSVLGGSGVWNISCGDRLFGQELDPPIEFYFTPKDTNEIDVLRTLNAPNEAGADQTVEHLDEITYYQATAPAHKAGRLWCDTDNGNVYRSDGTSWNLVADITDSGTINDTLTNQNSLTLGDGSAGDKSFHFDDGTLRTFQWDSSESRFHMSEPLNVAGAITRAGYSVLDTQSSVTDLSDVTDAGGGKILSTTVYNNLNDTNAQLAALHTDGSPSFSGLTVGSIIQQAGNNVIDTGDSVTALSDVTDAGGGKILTSYYYNAIVDANSQLYDLHTDGNPTFNNLQVDGTLDVTGNSTFVGLVESDRFSSGAIGRGWRMRDSDLTGTTSYLEIDEIRVRGTLTAHIFKKSIVRAVNGTIYVSDATEVAQEFTTPSSTGTSFTFYVKQQVFVSGDKILIQGYLSNGNIFSVEADITSNGTGGSTNGQDRYSYSATLTNGTSITVPVGETVVRRSGPTIIMEASSSYSPTLSLYEDEDLLRIKTGNLNGSYGYTSNIYGFAAGNPDSGHVTIDPSNGVRFKDSSGNVAAEFSGSTLSIGSGANEFTYNASTGSMVITVQNNFTLDSGNGDLLIDSVNKAISINSSTFGSSGIQLQYNSGSPRFYVGNGGNAYIQFDGTAAKFRSAGTNYVDIDGDSLSIVNSSTSQAVVSMGRYYDSDLNRYYGGIQIATETGSESLSFEPEGRIRASGHQIGFYTGEGSPNANIAGFIVGPGDSSNQDNHKFAFYGCIFTGEEQYTANVTNEDIDVIYRGQVKRYIVHAYGDYPSSVDQLHGMWDVFCYEEDGDAQIIMVEHYSLNCSLVDNGLLSVNHHGRRIGITTTSSGGVTFNITETILAEYFS